MSTYDNIGIWLGRITPIIGIWLDRIIPIALCVLILGALAANALGFIH